MKKCCVLYVALICTRATEESACQPEKAEMPYASKQELQNLNARTYLHAYVHVRRPANQTS